MRFIVYKRQNTTQKQKQNRENTQVLALGLLEDPQDKRAIGLPRKTEALHRFLLSQLDKEAAREPAIAPPASPATTPPNVCIMRLCLMGKEIAVFQMKSC